MPSTATRPIRTLTALEIRPQPVLIMRSRQHAEAAEERLPADGDIGQSVPMIAHVALLPSFTSSAEWLLKLSI